MSIVLENFEVFEKVIIISLNLDHEKVDLCRSQSTTQILSTFLCFELDKLLTEPKRPEMVLSVWVFLKFIKFFKKIYSTQKALKFWLKKPYPTKDL